jgi:hypothetical protein
LIKLRLLSPVNPKTEAENAISSRSVLNFGSTMTRAALAFCCRDDLPDDVIGNQLSSGDGGT